jgi:hypothetical protein
MTDPVHPAQAVPQGQAGRVIYERSSGNKRFLVIADFHEDGSYCFTQGKMEEGTWHRFLPSSEDVTLARRRLVEEQKRRAAASAVAAHVLARASLEALAAIPGVEAPTGDAYLLLDMEEHDLAGNEARRLALLRDSLERLLASPLPEAPRQDVQRVIQERLQVAQAAFSAAPATPPPGVESCPA